MKINSIFFSIVFIFSFSVEIFAVPLERLSVREENVSGVEEPLIIKTMSQDIETASYYELIAWCKRLNLSDKGSRKDLQNRLLQYYHIQTIEKLEKVGKKIEIQSAREAEYFDLKVVNEKYVTLRGNVIIKMIDNEKNVVHLIEAEEVTLNETQNLLTAHGNLEYHLIKAGKEEIFKGESLSFNIGTWEGVFYKGRTERDATLAGRAGKFFFYGKEMARKSNDIVTLTDGSVTSCSLGKDPHYHLQAKKLWILAPGEWAVKNATLYVGRIPLLIIPYFFYPGDKLFFHPSLGYRVREGNYIQTTTYLIGQKEQKSDIFSLLKVEGTGNGKYEEILKGIFLRKTGKIEEFGTKDYLKILFDLYSRLGVFIGSEGKFASGIEFKGGIGYSRDIFLNELTGLYTPFIPNANGDLVSYWNKSELFGLELPVRYGFSLNIDHQLGVFGLSGDIEMYSDPFFPSDFYNRSEGMDLDTIIGLNEPAGSVIGEKNNLTWMFKSKADLTKLLDIPSVKSFSIPDFNFLYYLQSREVENTNNDPVLSVDPSRKYYYPVNMTTPQFSLSIIGNIFKWNSSEISSSVKKKKPTGLKPSPKLKEPGKGLQLDPELLKSEQKKESISKESKGPGIAFIEPKPMKNISLKAYETVSTIDLDYQIKPRLNVVSSFNTSGWTSKELVDYSLLYSAINTNDYSKLSSNFGFFGGLLKLNQAIDFNANFNLRNKFSDTLGESEWNSLLLNDYKQRNLTFRNILGISISPLIDNEYFKGTNITYDLNMYLYKYSFVDTDQWGNPIYRGSIPSWDEETFQSNKIKGVMSYKDDLNNYALSIVYQLPPLEQSVTGSLDITAWITRTSIKESFVLEATGINYQPLVFNETLSLSDNLYISVASQLDIEALQTEQLNIKLSLFGMKGSLLFQNMYPVDPEGNQIGDSKEFLPTLLRLDYTYPLAKYYFWKNRIFFEPALSTYWYMDIQKFSNNEFNFSLKLNLFIYKFMELSFSSLSYNRRTYLYFPFLAGKIGVSPVNPVSELLKSFNFFNINDRYSSSFKIKTLSLKIIHHLHDWDVSVQYSGSPQLKTYQDGTMEYIWTPSFSINVQWNAVPSMKSNIRGDEEGIRIRG